MRKHAAVLALALTLAVPAFAESIGFRVQLTDARTALLANPQFDQLKLTDEQLARAAKDRVLMLDRTSGLKWSWLMLSWLETRPDVEHGINASGTAAVGKNADVGLTPIDAKNVRVRCLREACALTVADKTVKLKKNETHDVAFASDVRLDF